MKYMLEEEEINVFMKSLADELEISASQLQRDSKLDSINWDSLALISCIALEDENFGVTLTGEELSNSLIIEDIINLIPSKQLIFF